MRPHALPIALHALLYLIFCRDDAEGSDAWAVKSGWVSVTPLGLRQDLPAGEGGRSAVMEVFGNRGSGGAVGVNVAELLDC